MNPPIAAAATLAVDLVATEAPIIGVILHGSAVLGGWTPGRSDLDLLVIVDDAISPMSLRSIVAVLRGFDPAVRGMQIEASVVTRRAAATIRDRWPFLAHVASPHTGTMEDAIATPDASDPDLLMHYAVARHAGTSMAGEDPVHLIGPVARTAILGYLADEMRWGVDHAPAPYAILNACRARLYRAGGEIVSKVEGGHRCLNDPHAPRDTIEAAVAWQCGGHHLPVLDRATLAWIEQTRRMLQEASVGDD